MGDEIAIRDSAKKLLIVEQGAQYAAPNPVPPWLEANFENLSGRVLSLPKRKDVNLPINEQLIVELYRSNREQLSVISCSVAFRFGIVN